MARVGKTLLSSVLSTSKNVEYAEEPWTAQFFPIAMSNGFFDESHASLFFSEYIRQLFYETYLLRYANFRLIDLSYIGHKKPKSVIEHRINRFKNWVDVKDVSESIFMLNLSGTVRELKFIYDSIPRCKIIYVIRHAMSVAKEIERKKWFCAEALKNPISPSLYKKHKNLFLPFWIKNGEEDFFINLNEFEKGLYYYNVMVERSIASEMLSHKDCMIVKYEDFCSNKLRKYEKIKSFLELTEGDLTESSLAKIEFPKEDFTFDGIVGSTLVEQTNISLKYFGYEELL
jgi:hypothetical protein